MTLHEPASSGSHGSAKLGWPVLPWLITAQAACSLNEKALAYADKLLRVTAGMQAAAHAEADP